MADSVGDTDHTYFLTPKEAASMAEYADGSYGSIGVEFDDYKKIPTISAVTAGRPGCAGRNACWGSDPGGRRRLIRGPEQYEVLEALYGVPGTTVRLKVEHPELKTTVVVSVTLPGSTSPQSSGPWCPERRLP